MNRGEEVEITSLIFFFQETSCEIKEEIAKEEKKENTKAMLFAEGCMARIKSLVTDAMSLLMFLQSTKLIVTFSTTVLLE